MKKIYFEENDKITITDDIVDNEISENLGQIDEILQKENH
jgi:hypothetical protein